MSYASDHLAWQQRVNKEVNKAKEFTENYVPVQTDSNSPLKGLAEQYSSPYSFSDPNGIGKYDLKTTIKDMELVNRNKAQKMETFRKSASNFHEQTVGGATMQSTNQLAYNLYDSKRNSLITKLQSISPKRNEINKMLAKSNSTDVFTAERYPRPKNFFHQAYIAKSKQDMLSNAGSKYSRSRSIGKFAKVHYPPGHPKYNSSSKLPKIPSRRFNEDAFSEYSALSKRSKQQKLKKRSQPSFPSAFVEAGAVNKPTEANHLSNRSDNLKNMLIETIQHMNENEIDIMKTAIDSVKDDKKIKKPKKKVKKDKNLLSKSNLNQIKEDLAEDLPQELPEKPKVEDVIAENQDENEELQDQVEELPQKEVEEVEHTAAVPPIMTKGGKKSTKSGRSSRSSQYLAKLHEQIEKERNEREKLQKEIEEMRSMFNQSLAASKQLEQKS